MVLSCDASVRIHLIRSQLRLSRPRLAKPKHIGHVEMITVIVFVVLLFVGAPIGIVLAVSAAVYLIDAGNSALIGSYALQLCQVLVNMVCWQSLCLCSWVK